MGHFGPREEAARSKVARRAPRSGAELHKPERSGGAEASGLERDARAGISPINSKPSVLAALLERFIVK